jgi:hypothetical protein
MGIYNKSFILLRKDNFLTLYAHNIKITPILPSTAMACSMGTWQAKIKVRWGIIKCWREFSRDMTNILCYKLTEDTEMSAMNLYTNIQK